MGARHLVLVLAVAAALTPRAAAQEAPFPLLPTGTFAIVPGESRVTFFVLDNRGGFTGRTTAVTGRVTVEPPRGGGDYVARVEATIDARSFTTGNPLRDAAMRSTYLKTAHYPTITFLGTATARPGLGIHPFETTVQGQVTVRNVTRPVAFPATVVALASEYIADGTAVVRMADFGIPYPRAFIFVAHDPVTVTIHLRARRP